ncbi:Structural maintenance of chromosomes protein 6 [Basidiobolus ranarum]|uniref:Structural maintenance of chromosomes protein 6 n=1 Tax=Basidiobolus ranarum TaxID=34480 RepID=A0ABR2WUQ0_9FUNG
MCPPKFFVSKNDNFDYSAGEPDQRFLTALRVLEFSHEFVKRQMIVHANIEQTILVEKRTEANQIMGSGFPRNVNSCFTIDGFKVGHRGGGYATQAMNQYRGPPRFTQDLDKKIRQYQYSVEEKMETLSTQNDRLKEVDFEIREADRKKQMLNNKIGNFQKDITFKSRTIRQLHDQLQEEEPANIVALEEAKQDTERQIELIKNQFEQLQLQKTQIAEQEKLLREELDNIKREIESALDKMEQIKTKIEDQINERIQCETNKQYWTNKLEDEQGKILELQNEVTRRQEIVDETTAQAQEYCPERVEVTKTATQLDREINQIQLRLKESEKGFGGTIEEVLRDMKNKVDSYRKAKTEIANMERFVRDLKYALGLRLKRWDDFRSYIAKRARINFHWNLAQRGYSGKLEFDHKNRKLNPRVQVDDQAENLTRDKDPKSLSGGEKSFSTICLLLSLWEAMGCPIRCLDEFDVFMDAVNRKISMRMMIESARQADETQYILITPQDMSNVSPGPDIRVHRLNDPERNQPPLHS